MEARETLIERITRELRRLPEDYLETVFSVVARMGTQLRKDKPSEQTNQPKTLPFVDEIEQVREQSRRGAGPDGDRQFT